MKLLPSLLLAGLFTIATPLCARAQEGKITFNHVFAPTEGMVSAPEHPYRQELCLNGRWQFQPVSVPRDFKRNTGTPPELPLPDAAHWETTPLKVPSPWNVNTWGTGRNVGAGTNRPYTADSVYYPSYPASWDNAEMGWLRRNFRVPTTWGTRRVVLHFEGVAGEAQVFVNGHAVGTHFDSFLPFDFDVTALVKRNTDNELLVGVRKNDLFNKTSPDYPANQSRTYPNGSSFDRLAGLWNDVFLLGLPPVRVSEVFVKPLVDRKVLQAEITLRNDSVQPQTVIVSGVVQPWVNLAGHDVLSAPEPKWRLAAPVLRFPARSVTVPAQGTVTITVSQNVATQLRFWTPQTPNLYGLVLTTSQGGKAVDSSYTRFGWRQFTIRGRDLLLNGTKIQLVGDLLHPFGPYIGSRRFVWADYKMIKDVGGNATRPHAQPRPRFFLDLADEMGLCVLDESAIFGSSISLNLKEPSTWGRLAAHIDGLVMRDRNHASVFGWSTGNEMFAQFLRTTQADRDAQFPQLQQLFLRPQKLDSTRPWISVDGDEDLEGVLPTWSKHIGIGLPKLPDLSKPLMVGEQGGTYYAAPPLLAPLVGERAYQDYRGRSEGLAADVYRMITQAARPSLAYFSPSELGWFGIEHLPFGYHTDARVPNLSDGVFFGPYVEGQPGVQIERMPPYATTLNPGLDPSLPLYKPLPMFEAMKAALDPRGPQPSPWATITPLQPRPHPAATNTVTSVAFLGNRDGLLFQSLYAQGMPFAEANQAPNSKLLLIDGEQLSAHDVAQVQPLSTDILGRGGMVWVMIRDKGAALSQLQALLHPGVEVTPRTATSLLRGANDAVINGFDLGQLYFAGESSDKQILKCGLGGAALQNARVLLTASNTDWTLFDQHNEEEKNSNLLIYEHLRKPSGAALVELPRANGKLWLSALNYQFSTPQFRAFWHQLFQNVGVQWGKPPLTDLVATAQNGEGELWRYTTAQPDAAWFQPDFADAAWQTGRAGFGVEVPNSHPHTAWHSADIWLRHEFTVQKLPTTLTLQVHHDEDVEVYLNGVSIFKEGFFTTTYKNIPLAAQALAALKVGRNVIAVHCHQIEGGQYIDVGLSQLTPVTNAPEQQHDLLLQGPLNQ